MRRSAGESVDCVARYADLVGPARVPVLGRAQQGAYAPTSFIAFIVLAVRRMLITRLKL